MSTYHQRTSEQYVDVLDGEIYKSKRPGPNVVTLVWHIDGAPTIKSRNLQIWLITAFLIELGMKRYSLKIIVFRRLWYGPDKPDFDLFQISFTRQIRALIVNGFQITSNGQRITIYLNVQSQLADLPAKAASLKMKQYNGQYGCTICYHPGSYPE